MKIGEKEAQRRALREGATAPRSHQLLRAHPSSGPGSTEAGGAPLAVPVPEAKFGGPTITGPTEEMTQPILDMDEVERALRFYRKHRERQKEAGRARRKRRKAERS